MWVPPVIVWVIAAAFAATGSFLMISAAYEWRRRHRRRDLYERLRPFQPSSLAEEAQDWLQRQG
jgi:hypothetical protein